MPRSGVTRADTIIYRSSAQDCELCPMKARCCPNTPTRKIARQVNESTRDVARAIATTERYQQSRKDRKKVEMLFAHLKRILRLDRLRLRGLLGAQDEFLLVATAQNLRRMALWLMPKAPQTAHTLAALRDKGRCAPNIDRPLRRNLISAKARPIEVS